MRVRPPSSFDETAGTLDRVSEGGYEGPVSIAAVLAAIAIFLRAPTVWINGWLLVEGELLFLAGVRFGERYLRRLAATVFAVSIGKLGFVDVPANGATTIAGIHMKVWTPVALAHAAGFYLNRILHTVSRAYSWAAAAIVVFGGSLADPGSQITSGRQAESGRGPATWAIRAMRVNARCR